MGREDVVFEVGAGTGVLTLELAAAARRVTAVELDPALASRLGRRFASSRIVSVIEGDALTIPFPQQRFRAFGNIPFGITTSLLHRLLDDPISGPERADFIVQLQVARKHTKSPPGSLSTLSWTPWWEFRRGPRLPAYLFHPRPRTDAGVLTVVRRNTPLIDPSAARSYRGLITSAFRRAGETLPVALRGVRPARQVRSASRDAGIPFGSRPVDLTTEEWVALFARL